MCSVSHASLLSSTCRCVGSGIQASTPSWSILFFFIPRVKAVSCFFSFFFHPKYYVFIAYSFCVALIPPPPCPAPHCSIPPALPFILYYTNKVMMSRFSSTGDFYLIMIFITAIGTCPEAALHGSG